MVGYRMQGVSGGKVRGCGEGGELIRNQCTWQTMIFGCKTWYRVTGKFKEKYIV